MEKEYGFQLSSSSGETASAEPHPTPPRGIGIEVGQERVPRSAHRYPDWNFINSKICPQRWTFAAALFVNLIIKNLASVVVLWESRAKVEEIPSADVFGF